MDFEMSFDISELKTAVLTCKAVSDSFFNEFVAGNQEANETALAAAPERYVYLYKAVMDMLHDVAQRAAALEEKADAAMKQQQEGA